MKVKFFSVALLIAFSGSSFADKVDWEGLYVGGKLGVQKMTSDWETTQSYDPTGSPIADQSNPEISLNSSSPSLGAYVGYNWKIASNWLIGVEGGFDFSDNTDEADYIPGLDKGDNNSVELESDLNANIVARGIYLLTDDLSLYGSLGLLAQKTEITAICPADSAVCDPSDGTKTNKESDTSVAARIAFGAEMKIFRSWIARAEYSYADLGDFKFEAIKAIPGESFGADAKISSTVQAFSLGMAYKF